MTSPILTLVPPLSTRERRARRHADLMTRRDAEREALRQAAVLEALPSPTRDTEWKPSGFLSTPRGSIASYDPTRPLSSPRPVAYLKSFRCVDERLCTALDHALLEIVISAAYETDGLLVAGSYAVPMTSVLSILGTSTRRREIAESLGRLSTRLFALPALPGVRERRVRARTGPHVDWDDDDLYAYVSRIVLARTSDKSLADEAVWSLKGAVGVGEFGDVLRDLDRTYGIFDGGLIPALREGHTVRPPRTPIDVRLRFVEPAAASEQTEEGQVVFLPIRRHVVDCGDIVIEFDPHLTAFLDLTRTVRSRRTPFVHLDVRAMASFASRYTPPVYRQIVSSTIEAVVRDVPYRRDVALAKRCRPRVGWWTESLDLDTTAALTSYRWVAGGRGSQFARTVLPGLRRDLETLKGVLEVAVTFDGGLDFAIRHLPRTETIQGRYAELRRVPATVEVDHLTGRRFRHPTPREIAGRRLSPYDNKSLMVGVSAWSSIGRHLGLRTVRELEAAALAWHVAIGEMHGDALTESASLRRCRGQGLRSLIDDVGVNRAALTFFVEEWASPDLLRTGVICGLVADGTMKRFAQEREIRAAGRAPADRLERFTTRWLEDAAATVEAHFADEEGPVDFVAVTSLPSVKALDEKNAARRRSHQDWYNEGRRLDRER